MQLTLLDHGLDSHRIKISELRMLLRRSLSKWRLLLLTSGIIKVAAMVLTPPSADLLNWTVGASLALRYIVKGHFPPVSATGVYGPIELLLAPFFWIWTVLPIQHPPVYDMAYSNTTSALLLALLMKLLPFIADVITGVVVFKLTQQLTHSEKKSKLATIVWYLNPYNIFWINAVGYMDVIPTLVFLLAILLGCSSKWFRSGVCIAIASILRIYPIFSFPFFLLATKRKELRKTRGYAVLGFLLPLLGALIVLYASEAGTLNAVVELPKVEYWLLDFLGGNLTNVNLKLSLVLIPVQFYVTARYWKKISLLYSATVSVLALLVGAQNTPPYHFLWVSPLLTMCVVLSPDEAWIFLLTFITGSLHLVPIFGMFPMASFSLLDPFLGGCFYAAKATYLIKLNLKNIVTTDGSLSLPS